MQTGVAASGNALCPVIITSHKVSDGVYRCGHRPEKDFIIERNNGLHIDGPSLNLLFIINLSRI
jgi:hypothetical protein